MSLKEKILKRTANIGIVGLGYVGLPLAVEYADKGFRTLGIDVVKEKVKAINQGKSYINDIDNQQLRKAVRKGFLKAVDHYEDVPDLDVIFICVPTPFTPNKDPDVSFIIDAAKGIAKGLRKEQLVILKSTTFPNTTEGYVQPILEKTGLTVGKDFYLAFSPERIDPGNRQFNTYNTPIVVGGVTAKCTELTCLVTQQVVEKVIAVSSPKVAEMEKLLENIFRSVNIALVNELARLCDRMGGINVWEVIDTAATKPFGFMPFYPGPGIGGHCILIDPYYLAWQAREYDFQTKFITLAAETNEAMPYYVRGMVLRALANRNMTFQNAKILILGVAFKKNVDDTRHSPALKIMELLLQEGARNLSYNDPFVPQVRVLGKDYQSMKLTPKLLKDVDMVVITTDHSDYDYEMVVKNSKCIIDARNATKKVQKGREKIYLLGDGK
jgi:UDP-N-acetyl-D-glucosamine dehydrogenase